MRLPLTIAFCMFATASVAQQHSRQHNHNEAKASPETVTTALPKEAGQSAFAAIQEIVQILEADQKTDWAKVDIEGLRQHLIDMSNVTLYSNVVSTARDRGMSYSVSGTGPTRDSIRRMIKAHAGTMNGIDGWTFTSSETESGAIITVIVPEKDLKKIKGLGFIGVMTHGMHHQEHHLMLARGEHPHH